MSADVRVVLAIESAIAGGSVSLIRDGVELGNWLGDPSISRGEELLVNIDRLLTATRTSKSEIDLIAVSAGPGSFTGVRIGLATALGLKNGLETAMASGSVLAAMAASWHDGGPVTAAVPMGRGSVCVQSFTKGPDSVDALDEPHAIMLSTFVSNVISKLENTRYLVHPVLLDKMVSSGGVTNFGSNLAYAIGGLCLRDPALMTKPIFVSKTF